MTTTVQTSRGRSGPRRRPSKPGPTPALRFGCIIYGGSWESLSFFGELFSSCLCTSYGYIETQRSSSFRCSRLINVCRYRPRLQGKWILWIWKERSSSQTKKKQDYIPNIFFRHKKPGGA